MIKLMASAEFISDQSRDPDLHSFSTHGKESASTESSESLSRFHQRGKSRYKGKRRDGERKREKKKKRFSKKRQEDRIWDCRQVIT